MSDFTKYANARAEIQQIQVQLDRFDADVESLKNEAARAHEAFRAEGEIYNLYKNELDALQPKGTNEQRFAMIDAVAAKKAQRGRELIAKNGGTWSELSEINESERSRLLRLRPKIIAMKKRQEELKDLVMSFEDDLEVSEGEKNAEIQSLIDQIRDLGRDF